MARASDLLADAFMLAKVQVSQTRAKPRQRYNQTDAAEEYTPRYTPLSHG
jgi:hypothetical protein